MLPGQEAQRVGEELFMDPFPSWMQDLPEGDLPYTGPEGWLIASPHGQVVFLRNAEEVEVPPHAHGGEWGIVVTGRAHFTVDGESATYGPGETYEIPPGAEHSIRSEAGTSIIVVFQDPDRHSPK
jgi:quercetin dioxygenase-like cupin family protein